MNSFGIGPGARVELSNLPLPKTLDMNLYYFKIQLLLADGLVWRNLSIQQIAEGNFKILDIQDSDVNGNTTGELIEVNALVDSTTHRQAIRKYFNNLEMNVEFTKQIKVTKMDTVNPNSIAGEKAEQLRKEAFAGSESEGKSEDSQEFNLDEVDGDQRSMGNNGESWL